MLAISTTLDSFAFPKGPMFKSYNLKIKKGKFKRFTKRSASIHLPNVRMFIFNRDDIWSFKIVLQNTILRSSLLLLFLSNININNRDQLTLSIGWYWMNHSLAVIANKGHTWITYFCLFSWPVAFKLNYAN